MIDKEVRALLPAWTACALAILASRWQVEPLRYLGVPAYFIGTAGLGAWAVGHEYIDGTLTSMLTLPVPRHRIWSAKLTALAPMLAALAAIAVWSVPVEAGDRTFGAALFVLPPIVSLFVAPWLTMLTRSPIAGAVFTFGAIGGSLALGDWIGVWRYGVTDQVNAFRVAFMWWGLCGLAAVGAVLGPRALATLEAREAQSAELQLSFTRREAAAAVTRRPPLMRLIAKELRLQQLPIVVAALWIVAYSVAQMVRAASTQSPGITGIALGIFSFFYTLVLPTVIGSLACAEERHFGTLEAQLLLPVRSSTQWIVKSATALGLSVLLALVVPLALARLFSDTGPIAGPGRRLLFEAVVYVLGATCVSLYVSTLARSGLRALLGSIATIAAFGFVVIEAFDSGFGRQIFGIVHAASGADGHRPLYAFYFARPLTAFVLLTLLVALALPHYRYTERRPALVALQAAIALAGTLVAMNVIVAMAY